MKPLYILIGALVGVGLAAMLVPRWPVLRYAALLFMIWVFGTLLVRAIRRKR